MFRISFDIWTDFLHGLGYPIKVTLKIVTLIPFPLNFREIHDVWYNLLIQTGSNSSKQTWFLVSWLQHSKLNWFELTGKGQMKYLSTGTQSKACYQWHNPNHLDCVTTTMYGDQNPNWYLDCVSSVNPLDSDPSNTFGLWHPCPLVCVGTNSLDSVSFPAKLDSEYAVLG